MQTLLITLAALVLLRMLFSRKERQSPNVSFGMMVKSELTAWLLTAAVLAGAFLVVLVFTLFFGPIPPFHEWGNN
jgi:multisubunit Na+/H+ antiporter MnhB subunit